MVRTAGVRRVGREQGCIHLKKKTSSFLGLHGYGKMMVFFIEHRAQNVKFFLVLISWRPKISSQAPRIRRCGSFKGPTEPGMIYRTGIIPICSTKEYLKYDSLPGRAENFRVNRCVD